jgi:hypothetical protein
VPTCRDPREVRGDWEKAFFAAKLESGEGDMLLGSRMKRSRVGFACMHRLPVHLVQIKLSMV